MTLLHSMSVDKPPPAGVERRRHPRFDILAQVRVKQAQSDIVMELENVSLSGARLHLGTLRRPGWIAIGRVIEISIVHPVDLDNVEVQGRVVRVVEDADGTVIGVCFVEPDEHAQRGITRLVDTARNQPATPPRRAPPPLPKSE